MHILKELWQRISETGIHPGILEDEIRRVRLLNRMNGIMISMIILSVIPDLFKEDINDSFDLIWFQIIATIIPLSVFFCVFFLNKRRKYFAAKTLWFGFMFLLAVTPTYLTMNTDARIETFMLMIIPLLALLLYEDRRVAYSSVMITLLTYYFIAWLSPEPLIIFPETEKYLVLGFTAVTVVLLTDQLKLVNKKFENKLTEQKTAIEHQKNELHTKNKEITDSINYSRRLQDALLPPINQVREWLPDSFILYKPKDIVSGDFYWIHKKNDNLLIAAADCTGHGIPGAFTSFVCFQNLSDAVQQTSDPGEILAITNRGVKKALRQDNTAIMESGQINSDRVQEGMDIGLCAINLKMGIVKYSGAKRPLIIIRNGKKEIEEIKGTRESIGGDTSPDYKYETHTLQLNTGDTMYMYSDGYADQDGGEKGRHIMSKNFKRMLTEIQHMTMKEQQNYLRKFIDDYRGHRDQLDDILVIGIKL